MSFIKINFLKSDGQGYMYIDEKPAGNVGHVFHGTVYEVEPGEHYIRVCSKSDLERKVNFGAFFGSSNNQGGSWEMTVDIPENSLLTINVYRDEKLNGRIAGVANYDINDIDKDQIKKLKEQSKNR